MISNIVRGSYPQQEPPGSETFPAIRQSSDLLLTAKGGGHKEEQEVRQ